MFDTIDATGSGRKSDPRMRNVEAEMIRSHELCLIMWWLPAFLPR